MNALAVGLAMAFAAVTIGTGVGWLLAASLLPHVRRLRWPARSRALLLAQLRLLPLAATAVLVSAQALAFVRFEEARAESPGPALILLGLVGVALIADAVWRGVACMRQTTQLVALLKQKARPLVCPGWSGPAWTIHPTFPIVAVIGAFRPQLFIARQVINRCTPAEMTAIFAHEAAHVSAHDNPVQWLFVITPGACLVPGLATALQSQWLLAAEEAADVSAGQAAGYLELASALTKVARLTPAMPPAVMASALIGETNLDTRVRRLLQTVPTRAVTPAVWWPSLMLIITFVVTLAPGVSASVHELFETLVRPH